MAQMTLPPWMRGRNARVLLADAEPADTQVEMRHDRPLDRVRWHFAARPVAVHGVDIRPVGAA